MKSSYVIAAGMAVAVTGWVLSGQIGEGRTPAESATPVAAGKDRTGERLA